MPVDPRVGDYRGKMKLWASVMADMVGAWSIGFFMLEELGGSATKCSCLARPQQGLQLLLDTTTLVNGAW